MICFGAQRQTACFFFFLSSVFLSSVETGYLKRQSMFLSFPFLLRFCKLFHEYTPFYTCLQLITLVFIDLFLFFPLVHINIDLNSRLLLSLKYPQSCHRSPVSPWVLCLLPVFLRFSRTLTIVNAASTSSVAKLLVSKNISTSMA